MITEPRPKTWDLSASSGIESNTSGGASRSIDLAVSVRSRYTSSIEALSHLPFVESIATTCYFSAFDQFLFPFEVCLFLISKSRMNLKRLILNKMTTDRIHYITNAN